jgi:hypothetical protein
MNQASGVEFDWFLLDSDGCVAQMASAGSGRVPPWVLDDLPAHDRASEAVLALPASCDALVVARDPLGAREDWLAFAARGLYAYDSDYYGGPYRLIARPSLPARLSTLPPSLADALRRASPAPRRFRDSPSFRPEELGWVATAD